MGIDWDRPVEIDVPIGNEVSAFAWPTESIGLELVEHDGAAVLVDHGDVHVGGGETCGPPQLLRSVLGLYEVSEIFAVVVERHVAVQDAALGRPFDGHDRVAQVPGPLLRGHHEGHAAVAFLAAVKEPQYWFHYPT